MLLYTAPDTMTHLLEIGIARHLVDTLDYLPASCSVTHAGNRRLYRYYGRRCTKYMVAMSLALAGRRNA